VDHAFEHYPIQRNIVAEAYQAEAACALAACGLGVAIVEPFSASGFLPDQLAIKPFEPTVRFTMWFMVPSVRPRSRLLEAFTGLLLRVVAEEANFADPEPSSRGNSKPAALTMR
jgi:DNA-binding transcriptional LysR family regulator